MGDILPGEILVNVTTHLSPEKISTCVCVCRSWYTALIPTLYTNVEIKTGSQLDQFLDTLRSADALYPTAPLGHFVRKLTLSLHINRDQIAPLTRLCPFVFEVSTPLGAWVRSVSKAVQEWKYIKNIGPLRINTTKDIPLRVFRNRVTSLSISAVQCPELFDCITELPCIEELALGDSDSHAQNISLHKLEMLHKTLPRLRSLTLARLVVDGEMPKQIMPCDNVCNLYLCDLTGSLWGHYFAQKYTELKKLGFGCLFSDEDIKTELTALTRSCRHLERFENDRLIHAELSDHCMEILHEIGAPLTELYLYLEPTSVPATMINSFHKTVSKIEIVAADRDSPKVPLEVLGSCSCLVDLGIFCAWSELDMHLDRILDCCKHLRYAVFRESRIHADSNYATNSQHGLRTLSISGIVDEEVFPYLSQHCPRLSSLSCGISVFGPISYLLYFPSPSLESIHVSFFVSNIIYKVTRVSKPEDIIRCNSRYHIHISKRQTTDSTRWFYKERSNDRFLQELEPWETDPSCDQLRNDCDGWSLESSQEDGKHQELLDNIKKYHIVSIQCHVVDQIYLDNMRVRY